MVVKREVMQIKERGPHRNIFICVMIDVTTLLVGSVILKAWLKTHQTRQS